MTAATAPTPHPASAGNVKRGRLPIELAAYEIRSQAAGSVIGLAWAVLQPLLFLAAYWFFLTVLGARHLGGGDVEEEVVVLLSGLVVWLFVMRTLSSSLASLTSHAGFVRNVNFPIAVLPYVTVVTRTVDYIVGLVVVLSISAFAGLISWHLLLLVPSSIVLFAFLVAAATILGPLAVMVRDLARITQVTLRAGLFLTPVLYLPSAVPDDFEAIIYANPIAYFLSSIRYALTGLDEASMFDPATDLAIAGAITAIVAGTALLTRQFAWRRVVDHL